MMGPALSPSAESVLWALLVAARAAALLAACGLGALALRRSTAAARHRLWALGVTGALALPLLCLALPWLRLSVVQTAVQPGLTLLLPELSVGATAASTAPPSWLGGLVWPWATGALLCLIRSGRAHLAARRLWRRSEPTSLEPWRVASAQAAQILGIHEPVELRRSAEIGSPMSIGLRSARVLLPAEAEGWSPERLHAVLLHELGHVRRRDNLLQALAQINCALYWFNPLAWVAASRLRLEREHAADDLVLAAGVRPSSYASDLLEVARRLSALGAAREGAVCMADPGGAGARLRRVLDPSVPRQPLPPWTRPAAWILSLGAAGLLAATASPLKAEAGAAVSRGELSARPLDSADSFYPPAAISLNIPYDLRRVTAEVELHLPELQACYQRRLSERPGLSGEIVIHWVLLPSGEISEQCLTSDTVEDETVRACVNHLVAMSAFASPGAEPADISLPLRFQPGA